MKLENMAEIDCSDKGTFLDFARGFARFTDLDLGCWRLASLVR